MSDRLLRASRGMTRGGHRLLRSLAAQGQASTGGNRIATTQDLNNKKNLADAKLVEVGNLGTTATMAANILTNGVNGAFPQVDTTNVDVGDRVVLAGQTNKKHRGLFTLTDAGGAGTPWKMTRAADFDHTDEITSGATVKVIAGGAKVNTYWTLLTDDPIRLNHKGEADKDLTFLESAASALVSTASLYGILAAGDGSSTGYTPTTGADWTDVDPTNVMAALDLLAARVGPAADGKKMVQGAAVTDLQALPNVMAAIATNGSLVDITDTTSDVSALINENFAELAVKLQELINKLQAANLLAS